MGQIRCQIHDEEKEARRTTVLVALSEGRKDEEKVNVSSSALHLAARDVEQLESRIKASEWKLSVPTTARKV